LAHTVEASTVVATPPDRVWRLLENPYQWHLWWPALDNAETADHKPLHDGSRLALALELGVMSFKVRGRVELFAPGRSLVWTGRLAGARLRHSIFLEPRPNGTWVCRRESYEGAGALLARLLRLDRASAKGLEQSLRGLKRLAERSG